MRSASDHHFRSALRPLAIGVAVVAGAGLVAAGPATAAPAATAHRVGATHTTSRHVGGGSVRGAHVVGGAHNGGNWSGYVKTAGSFTSSAASWTVPTVATTYNGLSSTWVGIDGFSNQYLVQTGTTADVVNHKASYKAWWEVITPNNLLPQENFSMAVHPGNKITGTITKSGGSWTMTLKNATTGASATHSYAVTIPGASAEWIQEDTSQGQGNTYYVQPAPNWHSVTFSGITVNGANPHLVNSQSYDLYDASGTHEDSTGAPNSTTNGFTVTWLASGTAYPLGSSPEVAARQR